jgi:hypothetical protein
MLTYIEEEGESNGAKVAERGKQSPPLPKML